MVRAVADHRTGYIWIFPGEARDPGQIKPATLMACAVGPDCGRDRAGCSGRSGGFAGVVSVAPLWRGGATVGALWV